MNYTTQQLVEAANNPSALLAIAKELNAKNDELSDILRDIQLERLEKKVRKLEADLDRADQLLDQKSEAMLLTWQFLTETGQAADAIEWSNKKLEKEENC